jgi:hypothetical protein
LRVVGCAVVGAIVGAEVECGIKGLIHLTPMIIIIASISIMIIIVKINLLYIALLVILPKILLDTVTFEPISCISS